MVTRFIRLRALRVKRRRSGVEARRSRNFSVKKAMYSIFTCFRMGFGSLSFVSCFVC